MDGKKRRAYHAGRRKCIPHGKLKIALLEKWCGIPGPAAPWLLTALAANLVSLRKQPLLALFSSEQEHFISTITPGSEDESAG